MSTEHSLITELRSAAATLRTPTGSLLPAQDRITAELLERAALEMAMGIAWYGPDENLPDKPGTKVLAHIVQPAGSEYAVKVGQPQGWQTLDMARFERRADGTAWWDHETNGLVLKWRYVDDSALERRAEPWLE